MKIVAYVFFVISIIGYFIGIGTFYSIIYGLILYSFGIINLSLVQVITYPFVFMLVPGALLFILSMAILALCCPNITHRFLDRLKRKASA